MCSHLSCVIIWKLLFIAVIHTGSFVKERNCMLLFYPFKMCVYVKNKKFNASHNDCVVCIFTQTTSSFPQGSGVGGWGVCVVWCGVCVCVCVLKGGRGMGVLNLTQMSPPDLAGKQKEDWAGPVIAGTSVHFYILSSHDTKAKISCYNLHPYGSLTKKIAC